MKTTGQPPVSRKTVVRLSLYRRILGRLRESGTASIYSHRLARAAGVSAAQVRRDCMMIGHCGCANRGYPVDTCLAALENVLDNTDLQEVALVGVEGFGRFLLTRFRVGNPQLRVSVGFDTHEGEREAGRGR